jgi:hypothetical protein
LVSIASYTSVSLKKDPPHVMFDEEVQQYRQRRRAQEQEQERARERDPRWEWQR